MTRGQYIAMCIIGAVAILAYLQSLRVAEVLNSMLNGGYAGAGSGVRI